MSFVCFLHGEDARGLRWGKGSRDDQELAFLRVGDKDREEQLPFQGAIDVDVTDWPDRVVGVLLEDVLQDQVLIQELNERTPILREDALEGSFLDDLAISETTILVADIGWKVARDGLHRVVEDIDAIDLVVDRIDVADIGLK